MIHKNNFEPFVNDNFLYLNNESEGHEGVCIQRISEKERKKYGVSSIYRQREFSKYLYIYSSDAARRKTIIFLPTGEIVI